MQIQGQFTVTHWHEDELRRYEEEAKRIRAERELLFASNEENAPIHRQQSDVRIHFACVLSTPYF